MLLAFFLPGKVCRWLVVDVRRKTVFTLYIREYTHYLKRKSGWLSYILPVERILWVSSNKQQGHWDSICLGTSSPNWSWDFTYWVNCLICGPANTPSLILASLLLGDLFFKYMNAALLWSLPLRNFLWVQVWCAAEVDEPFQYWRMECLPNSSVLE